MSYHFDKSLPRCKGPKLHPFLVDRDYHIEFVRLLSNEDESGHSHVLEIAVNGQHYALKVFKYFENHEIFGDCYFDITTESHRMHGDPFFNECRAYGRLIETGTNGRIAVRCHGHLPVPADREEELRSRFGVAWARPRDESKLPPSERPALRAIVKDLVQVDKPITGRMLVKMHKDLLKMRDLGILPRDIYPRNYGAGLLLDFSIAITKPHWFFEDVPLWHVRYEKNRELTKFEDMVEASGVRTSLRVFRDLEYCKKLRNCPNGRMNTQRKRYPA